jgi:predicted dinucleotide-binding enzyme
MHITIIGTGNVGGALAENWADKGHQIHLGVRDTSHFKGKHLLAHQNISAHLIDKAVTRSGVILLAVSPQVVADVVDAMGDVRDKIIIDAMNSFRKSPEGYEHTFEALRELAKGAELVKCFNTTGFENLRDPVYHGKGVDMFMAGNSKRAKDLAKRLALDAGFDSCYDFGGDEQVLLLEELARCWINLSRQELGRNFAFRIVTRE